MLWKMIYSAKFLASNFYLVLCSRMGDCICFKHQNVLPHPFVLCQRLSFILTLLTLYKQTIFFWQIIFYQTNIKKCQGLIIGLSHRECVDDYTLHVSFAGLTTEDIQQCFWRGNHLNVFVIYNQGCCDQNYFLESNISCLILRSRMYLR